MVSKALKRERETKSGFSSTGGTVSEGGKQQTYKTSVFQAKTKAGCRKEVTSIRPESPRLPEIRAGRDPGSRAQRGYL